MCGLKRIGISDPKGTDRTLDFNFEIPIGIVTALIGVPFFMLVLKNARKGWQ